MAGIVDLRTGKIIGCKKGSRIWWHEKGHIKFNNSELGIKIDFWRSQVFIFTVTFLMLTFFIDIFKWFGGFSLIVYYFLNIYEEIWCNEYARRKMKK